MSNSSILTIGIPTYNRSDALAKTLGKIVPQLQKGIEIIIFDNNSPDYEKTLMLVTSINSPQVKLQKNASNVGGAGNSLKCIECAQSKWLWLLSDDDNVEDDAVETIINDIALAEADCVYINYYSPAPGHMPRKSALVGKGVKQLCDSCDSIASILFLSSGVYSLQSLRGRDGVRVGHLFSSTLAPHVAALLCAIGSGNQWLLSNKIIVRQGAKPPAEQFSSMPLFRSLPYLAFSCPGHAERFSVAASISRATRQWLRPRSLILNQALECKSVVSLISLLEYVRIMISFNSRLNFSPLDYLRWGAMVPISLFPGVVRFFLRKRLQSRPQGNSRL